MSQKEVVVLTIDEGGGGGGEEGSSFRGRPGRYPRDLTILYGVHVPFFRSPPFFSSNSEGLFGESFLATFVTL
jgi:hypothetical protein